MTCSGSPCSGATASASGSVVHAWAYLGVLELRKSEAERFRSFAQAGDLVHGRTLGDDIEEVAELVRADPGTPVC